ncbi:MAG: membrane lipoprotein lipid attachment site-containing protein [Chloroflexi bacterium]|nr:membrane lipoprotein lipid attachment site-containing protein [Chloroflexota bacterium]
MKKTILILGFALALTACTALPFFGATPLPPNVLAYEAPVSLTIKKDTLLPGTTLAYNGKSETGAARLMIAGQLAPKQVADNVEWQGSPAPNLTIKLATRVATFDDSAITLIGTAHVEIKDIKPQAGGTPGTPLIEFGPLVTYSLAKNEFVPGTNLAYTGSTANSAQFIGVEGVPYRKSGDSIQYNGRLAPKVFLRLDLRLIRFTETDAVVGGQAKIIIEQ